MLHVFIGEILANMTQVSDVAPGPLVLFLLVVISEEGYPSIFKIFGSASVYERMRVYKALRHRIFKLSKSKEISSVVKNK
jgi:hypothetical protein